MSALGKKILAGLTNAHAFTGGKIAGRRIHRVAVPEGGSCRDQRKTRTGNFAACRKKRLTMRFQGKVYKDGKFWLAEVPIFAAMTQGRTRKEALVMIADWFETMANRPSFSVTVHEGKKGTLEISSSDTRTMVSLLLQRQRQLSGLSLAAAAARLGARSRNAYARYERGGSVPTVEKLDELLHAVSGGRDFVLLPSPLENAERGEEDGVA